MRHLRVEQVIYCINEFGTCPRDDTRYRRQAGETETSTVTISMKIFSRRFHRNFSKFHRRKLASVFEIEFERKLEHIVVRDDENDWTQGQDVGKRRKSPNGEAAAASPLGNDSRLFCLCSLTLCPLAPSCSYIRSDAIILSTCASMAPLDTLSVVTANTFSSISTTIPSCAPSCPSCINDVGNQSRPSCRSRQ